ncbi:hypothetical protein CAI21_06545 [Alkalilimnicola ehrlichii]|uniref:LPS-assembly lipoprotein LptE n=1 Tax=Alkalilimnicola ehrlichii TaxID=351052 RepID=A0A3E0WZN9_9GAMM|nr:LPS assembly lipoprotein LptE [Alkalilimnicola ehrlichii]RFA30271.1 hypothetical protein CAI21_06545 [Alkalilimnicola ehrlichii]RFA37849.1 hypothetical protein CAL65_07895 [Alkalilimnicola ehrlichii]
MLLRASLIMAFALVLSACGWQLRGAGAIPLDGIPVAVVTEANLPEVERELRRGMERAGAVLVDEREQAEAVLVLISEQRRRRASAVDRDARAQEYELEYGLRFRVESPEGEPWGVSEVVTNTRSYRYDRDDVLATEAREEVVLEELRRDTTRLLLARAQATMGRNL